MITLSNIDGVSRKAIPKNREGGETSTAWPASYISRTAGQLWKVQSMAESDVLMQVHHPAQVFVMETTPVEMGPASGRIKKMNGPVYVYSGELILHTNRVHLVNPSPSGSSDRELVIKTRALLPEVSLGCKTKAPVLFMGMSDWTRL